MIINLSIETDAGDTAITRECDGLGEGMEDMERELAAACSGVLTSAGYMLPEGGLKFVPQFGDDGAALERIAQLKEECSHLAMAVNEVAGMESAEDRARKAASVTAGYLSGDVRCGVAGHHGYDGVVGKEVAP
jgi:hypothetical protein